MKSPKIVLLLVVVSLAVCAAVDVRFKQWVYEFACCDGSFHIAETTTKVSIDGALDALKNGFTKLTVEKVSGAAAPTVGFTQFGVDFPGFGWISGHFLNSDTRLTLAPITGTCPTKPWTGVFTYSKWYGTAGTTTDVSSKAMVAFGVSTWKPDENLMLDWEARNLVDYSRPPGFSPITLNGTCKNGVITFTGDGDRGGLMFISPELNSTYLTKTERAMFMHNQQKTPSLVYLKGDYVAVTWFGYGETAMFTKLNFGDGMITGNDLSDVSGDVADPQRRWKFTKLVVNKPFDGVMTADWQFNDSKASKVACAVKRATESGRILIHCVGQAPWDPKSPVNMAMLSN